MHKDSLRVGSDSDLNCTLENYNIFDFNVFIFFTWSRSSNNSERTFISSRHGLFTSQLTLSPVSAKDKNITCSVSANLATPNPYVEMSPTASKHVQLNIEGTTP